jgi:hypothetical protein
MCLNQNGYQHFTRTKRTLSNCGHGHLRRAWVAYHRMNNIRAAPLVHTDLHCRLGLVAPSGDDKLPCCSTGVPASDAAVANVVVVGAVASWRTGQTFCECALVLHSKNSGGQWHFRHQRREEALWYHWLVSRSPTLATPWTLTIPCQER